MLTSLFGPLSQTQGSSTHPYPDEQRASSDTTAIVGILRLPSDG
jgi:hypothetical protein